MQNSEYPTVNLDTEKMAQSFSCSTLRQIHVLAFSIKGHYRENIHLETKKGAGRIKLKVSDGKRILSPAELQRLIIASIMMAIPLFNCTTLRQIHINAAYKLLAFCTAELLSSIEMNPWVFYISMIPSFQ